MSENNKQKIDIRELHSDTKEKIKKSYNALRRYGYWATIIILLVISIIFATLTIGDVYKMNDISVGDLIKKYEEAGHEISQKDKTIISDIVIEALSKDEIITYNEFDRFLERIQSYNYFDGDDEVRFDSIIFYLYTKTPQELLNFKDIEKWRLVLVIINAVLALLTTFTFMQTGIQDALNVDFIKEKRKELISVSEEAARKRMYANYYFNRVYADRLKHKRETVLLDNGLLYNTYFDEHGILRSDISISDDEKKILKNVLKLRIQKVSYDNLVNYGNSKNDEEKYRDIKEYQKSTGTKSIITKVAMVVLFTFVSVSLIVTSQNGKQVMLNLVSTIVAFVAGFLQYLNSYDFITNEYASNLDAKIRDLKAFVAWEIPKELLEVEVVENKENEEEKIEEKEVDKDEV